MNNECGVQYGTRTHTCTLRGDHGGNHIDYTTRFAWPQEQREPHPLKIKFLEYKPEEKQHNVQLTLEDLKGLVYALSGPEWLEDEPELVAKIDKALKEAL